MKGEHSEKSDHSINWTVHIQFKPHYDRLPMIKLPATLHRATGKRRGVIIAGSETRGIRTVRVIQLALQETPFTSLTNSAVRRLLHDRQDWNKTQWQIERYGISNLSRLGFDGTKIRFQSSKTATCQANIPWTSSKQLSLRWRLLFVASTTSSDCWYERAADRIIKHRVRQYFKQWKRVDCTLKNAPPALQRAWNFSRRTCHRAACNQFNVQLWEIFKRVLFIELLKRFYL